MSFMNCWEKFVNQKIEKLALAAMDCRGNVLKFCAKARYYKLRGTVNGTVTGTVNTGGKNND
jgi:hypothetical protein